jgi:predicted glycogen debranching enzyme
MTLDAREWLETDGLGGFASGTVAGVRTRRYHGLLVTATTPPTGRMMLVNGFDASIETDEGTTNLTCQRYAPDVLYPATVSRLEQFQQSPWPTWRWRLNDEAGLIQEVFMTRGAPRVIIHWRLAGRLSRARLEVKPYLSGRDYHATHHENPAFNTMPTATGPGLVEWHPYEGVPGIRLRSNGSYHHAPDWYRNFLYLEERRRGLDDTEDLVCPGRFEWDLAAREAVWIIESAVLDAGGDPPAELASRQRDAERERRRVLPSRLHRSAEQYVVARGDGDTVIAGYPWFTDWGRDTFIAVRGLCLAAGQIAAARRILLTWARHLSDGMLPNRFPDAGAPEFNAVDASLWFIIAVHDLLNHEAADREVNELQRRELMDAVHAILRTYTQGARDGIRADADGLLAAGVPGAALTWMDGRAGEACVTPRIGKPVEVQALWLNALAFARRESTEWRGLHERGLTSFHQKFWNADRGCLYDVVDVDHVPGQMDGSLRPNQILAVGGLPAPVVAGPRASTLVDLVERTLVTPLGLRTLGPDEPGYAPIYEGDPDARAHSYHQGTAWPWLLGPFVDAWVRVRGNTAQARSEAHDRFVRPLLDQLDRSGVGHLPELADGEPPFTPRGCPFQAWSMGELLRLVAGRL